MGPEHSTRDSFGVALRSQKNLPKTNLIETSPSPMCPTFPQLFTVLYRFFMWPLTLKVHIQCPISSLFKKLLKNGKTVHANKLLNDKSCLKAVVRSFPHQHCGLFLCLLLDCEPNFLPACTLESDHSLLRVACYRNVQLHLFSIFLINVLASAFVKVSSVISLDDQLWRTGDF